MKIRNVILSGAAGVLLSACNGMFSGIYDEPDAKTVSEFGFVTPVTVNGQGTVYIDATDYTKWVYIDFANRTVETTDVDSPAPAQWDIAVHRYDVKTNGGEVAETDVADFIGITTLSESFVEDEWTTDVIVTDMSTMMDGYLSYADSFHNPVLSRWLDVDKSTMPPIYTMSGRVYVVRLSDGRCLAVRLDNYMNDAGVKGYMTISYKYPFEI